jgi:hypothetical protein
MFASSRAQCKIAAGGVKNRALRTYVGMRAITYGGQLVAVVTGASVHLAPQISELPAGHPRLRLVAAMCLYSGDVDQGEVPGPYTDWAAELYARCLLIPDDEFERFAPEADEELALRFSVPIEQVGEKRRDLRQIGRKRPLRREAAP